MLYPRKGHLAGGSWVVNPEYLIAKTSKAWGITIMTFLEQPIEHQAEMLALELIEDQKAAVEEQEKEQSAAHAARMR